MASVKWIKITTGMFEDDKIDFIQSMPEADAIIVIWVRLLTMAGKCNAGGFIYLTENIPYTSEMLAHRFRKPESVVRLALETFSRLGMVEIDDKGIFIANWDKHQNVEGLDKIREQTKNRVARHRENKKLLECNVTCNATVTDGNETEEEVDIEKDIKDICAPKAHLDKFFNHIWSLYPEKVGKGKVSKAQKENLQKVGAEQIERCISRYVKHVEERRKKGFADLKYQNGSTFFNKGYIDYLDENWGDKTKPTEYQKPTMRLVEEY